MMESDKNHLHLLIDIPYTLSIVKIIQVVKQQTTWNAWKKHSMLLKQHFWKEKTLWSDGHFVCSTGDVSTETILKYIRSQG